MVVNYYNNEKLCSKINVDIHSKVLSVENYTENVFETAFGVITSPTWVDFMEFLEDRCFPRNRQNLKLELRELGLDEYDPLKICLVTNGRNYKDSVWMRFEEENEGEYEDYESGSPYVVNHTTSDGAQQKIFKLSENTWYKQDYLGTEGLSEYAVSQLLALSGVPYVSYLPSRFYMINKEVVGVKSENFLTEGESLISVHRLLKKKFGFDIEKAIVPMDIEEKIRFFVDKVIETTGYEDFGVYLTNMLQLDAVTKNDDRHFNNISFIMGKNGKFRPAPIYDNGGAFLSDQYTYGYNLSYEQTISSMDKVKAKPFSADFDEQLDACEKLYPSTLHLQKDLQLDEKLLDMYDIRDIEKVYIILRQSQRKYRYLFSDR